MGSEVLFDETSIWYPFLSFKYSEIKDQLLTPSGPVNSKKSSIL